MGAFMALFGRASLPWIRKDPDKCTKCRVCLRVCPMDHDRVYDEMRSSDVGGEDCTLCARCVEMCPEEGCLSLSYGPVDIKSSRRPRKVGIRGRLIGPTGKEGGSAKQGDHR